MSHDIWPSRLFLNLDVDIFQPPNFILKIFHRVEVITESLNHEFVTFGSIPFGILYRLFKIEYKIWLRSSESNWPSEFQKIHRRQSQKFSWSATLIFFSGRFWFWKFFNNFWVNIMAENSLLKISLLSLLQLEL